MIRFIENGNIFTIERVHCYAHGCNCAGAMGKGIALQFKNKCPQMYVKYKKLCKGGAFTLGDIFEYNSDKEHIYNLGTQKDWRSKAELDAIKEAVYKMMDSATRQNITAIALPKIGAGLGGLNWEDVKNVLEETSNPFPKVDLYVVENFK